MKKRILVLAAISILLVGIMGVNGQVAQPSDFQSWGGVNDWDIDLSWKWIGGDWTNFDYFNIYRSTSDSIMPKEVHGKDRPAVKRDDILCWWVDTDIIIGQSQKYYYWITAVDVNGNESEPLIGIGYILEDPQFQGVAISDTSIKWSWNNVYFPDSGKYIVEDPVGYIGETKETEYIQTLTRNDWDELTEPLKPGEEYQANVTAIIYYDNYYGKSPNEEFKTINLISSCKSNQLRLLPKFSLHQNFPNPFNPLTTISYSIAKPSYVVLKIYNITGQEIAKLVDEQKQTGTHSVQWNARDIPSGMYVCQMETGDYIARKKMMLVK